MQRAHGTAHRSVLIVGNPALPLKGFDVAVAVLTAVNRVLPLMVTWICQVQLGAVRDIKKARGVFQAGLVAFEAPNRICCRSLYNGAQGQQSMRVSEAASVKAAARH